MIPIWEVAIAIVTSGTMWLFAYLAVSLKMPEDNDKGWTYTEALRMFFFACSFGAALLSLGVAMEITEGRDVHDIIAIGYGMMWFVTISVLWVLLLRILHRSLSNWRFKKSQRQQLPGFK